MRYRARLRQHYEKQAEIEKRTNEGRESLIQTQTRAQELSHIKSSLYDYMHDALNAP